MLAVDVGAGTLDVLVAEQDQRPENWPKLVVPSRSAAVARQIGAATAERRAVVFRGPTMGGGADSRAMKAHVAAGLPFFATAPAALTFDDDLAAVGAAGVQVLDEAEAEREVQRDAVDVRSGDVDLGALAKALACLAVPTAVTAAAVAAQDHGFSPMASNRILRFRTWERAVAEHRPLSSLFWRVESIPTLLTRLRAAANCLAPLGVPILAGDTGPAALLGAMGADTSAILVNVGNGHTICVVALDGRLAGVLEHHTGCLDERRLAVLLRRFLAGEVTDDEVRADGGHGAVLRSPVPTGLPLLVTGPRRDLLVVPDLAVRFPAPYGDMMMTGPAGLLRACQVHGLWPGQLPHG